jgi:hypothetical protein
MKMIKFLPRHWVIIVMTLMLLLLLYATSETPAAVEKTVDDRRVLFARLTYESAAADETNNFIDEWKKKVATGQGGDWSTHTHTKLDGATELTLEFKACPTVDAPRENIWAWAEQFVAGLPEAAKLEEAMIVLPYANDASLSDKMPKPGINPLIKKNMEPTVLISLEYAGASREDVDTWREKLVRGSVGMFGDRGSLSTSGIKTRTTSLSLMKIMFMANPEKDTTTAADVKAWLDRELAELPKGIRMLEVRVALEDLMKHGSVQ